MGKTEELLAGAIDMHCHVYPDFSKAYPPRPLTDEQNVRQMREAGMGGVVLKSHFWPTMPNAEYLKQLVPDIGIFSSITLNHNVGGLKAWAVEAAISQGAQVVWLPTWSTRNDLERNGMIRTIQKYLTKVNNFTAADAITAIDEQGNVLPDIQEIFALVKEYDIPLFTGHYSVEESLILAREAKRQGYNKLVFGHPDSRTVGAKFEEVVAMAEQGAYIEIRTMGLLPDHRTTNASRIAKVIRTVGADKCLITTDFFYEATPSVAEQFVMIIDLLLAEGIKETEIKQIAQKTPQKLLGLN